MVVNSNVPPAQAVWALSQPIPGTANDRRREKAILHRETPAFMLGGARSRQHRPFPSSSMTKGKGKPLLPVALPMIIFPHPIVRSLHLSPYYPLVINHNLQLWQPYFSDLDPIPPSLRKFRFRDSATELQKLILHFDQCHLSLSITLSNGDADEVLWTAVASAISSHMMEWSLTWPLHHSDSPQALYTDDNIRQATEYSALPWEFIVLGNKGDLGRLLKPASLNFYDITLSRLRKLAGDIKHPFIPQGTLLIIGQLVIHTAKVAWYLLFFFDEAPKHGSVRGTPPGMSGRHLCFASRALYEAGNPIDHDEDEDGKPSCHELCPGAVSEPLFNVGAGSDDDDDVPILSFVDC